MTYLSRLVGNSYEPFNPGGGKIFGGKTNVADTALLYKWINGIKRKFFTSVEYTNSEMVDLGVKCKLKEIRMMDK